MTARTESDLTAADHDIRVTAGQDVTETFEYVDKDGYPLDTTGVAFVAQIKAAGIETLIDLTVTNSGTTGLITVTATAAGLSAVTAGGTHYWDLTPDDIDYARLQGFWIVEADQVT